MIEWPIKQKKYIYVAWLCKLHKELLNKFGKQIWISIFG